MIQNSGKNKLVQIKVANFVMALINALNAGNFATQQKWGWFLFCVVLIVGLVYFGVVDTTDEDDRVTMSFLSVTVALHAAAERWNISQTDPVKIIKGLEARIYDAEEEAKAYQRAASLPEHPEGTD